MEAHKPLYINRYKYFGGCDAAVNIFVLAQERGGNAALDAIPTVVCSHVYAPGKK